MAASIKKNQSVCTDEESYELRVKTCVINIITPIFGEVLKEGTKDKLDSETFKEYLERCNKITKNQNNSPKIEYNNVFNKDQRTKIDKDKKCESFDVSLLYIAIRWGCDDFADAVSQAWFKPPYMSSSVEYNLNKLKNLRNDIFHHNESISHEDMCIKMGEINDLLMETLDLLEARNYFTKDKVTNLKTTVADKVENNKILPLERLDRWFDCLKDILLEEGPKALIQSFKEHKWMSVNLAIITTLEPKHFEINQIFTTLEILHDGKLTPNNKEEISYVNFLQRAHTMRKNLLHQFSMQIILVEGIAGVGKTTLMKILIYDWVKAKESTKHPSIEDVDNYDFIIPILCRNSYSSLKDLLASFMPKAGKYFHDGKLMLRCLLACQCLIIVEGLDELNPASKEILKEIIELKETQNLTVICTTRPEKVNDYYNMLHLHDHISTMHIKVKGVPDNKREEFVEKYHDELINQNLSNQNTKELVNFLRTTEERLKDTWTLPLNLTMLALLWAYKHERVNNITSPTQLFFEIHELTIDWLLKRISTQGSGEDLKKNVKAFLLELYKVALFGIRDEKHDLKDDSIYHLKETCKTNKLHNPDEILSQFLVQRRTWITTSKSTSFMSFPLKSTQEFYAANYIYNQVFHRKISDVDGMVKATQQILNDKGALLNTITEVTRVIEESETQDVVSVKDVFDALHKGIDKPPNFTVYQNTLAITLALVYQKRDDVGEDIPKEIIQHLQKTGIQNRDQWLTVLNSVHCNETISKIIAALPGIIEGIIDIRDNTVASFLALFKGKMPDGVVIQIDRHPDEIPQLDDLLLMIGEKQTLVQELSLHHEFKDPQPIKKLKLKSGINKILKSGNLKSYMGHMPAIINDGPPDEMVNSYMQSMEISVTNDDSFIEFHRYLTERLKRLQILTLSIAIEAVSTEILQPLPALFELCLFLPNVTKQHIDKASQIIKKLQPINGYHYMCFPRSELSYEDIEELVTTCEGVVCKNGIAFPGKLRSTDTKKDEDLRTLVKNKLQCKSIEWGSLNGHHINIIYDMDKWELENECDV